MSQSIKASLIIEILGRPPEHIKDALSQLVEKLGSEKGIKILEKTIHEPKKVEKSNDLYTTFAEIVVEFDSLANYFGVIFAYMPAHMELISPEKHSLSNSELNELGNRIISRLHDYDAITKKMIYERNFILSRINQENPNFLKNLKESLGPPKDAGREGGDSSEKAKSEKKVKPKKDSKRS